MYRDIAYIQVWFNHFVEAGPRYLPRKEGTAIVYHSAPHKKVLFDIILVYKRCLLGVCDDSTLFWAITILETDKREERS